MHDVLLTFSLGDNPKFVISLPFFAERGELWTDPWFLVSILQLPTCRGSLAISKKTYIQICKISRGIES